MAMNTHEAACAALAIAFEARIPALLVGAPGTGKTSFIEQMAADKDYGCEVILGSIADPTDFAGIPEKSEEGVRYAAPAWAKRACERPSIAFFDEFNTASPSVQNASLRIILNGVVGDTKLPDHNWRVGAMNKEDINTSGWALEPRMNNRFLHINWAPPAGTVANGFLFGFPNVQSITVDRDTADGLRFKHLSAIGAFLKNAPDFEHVEPSDPNQAAWPSGRTWEYVANLMAHFEASSVSDEDTVRNTLVIGCVGEAAGFAYLEWLSQQDLPNPEDLLKDPTSWEVPVTKQDQVYATASAVFAAMRSNLNRERWIAAGDVYARIANAGLDDIAFTFGQQWAAIRGSDEALKKDRKAIPSAQTMIALKPILDEIRGELSHA